MFVYYACRIYLCTSYLPKLLEQFKSETNVTALQGMIIDPLKELIEDMDKFQQLIEQTIDLDAAEKGDFMINPGFADDFKSNFDCLIFKVICLLLIINENNILRIIFYIML